MYQRRRARILLAVLLAAALILITVDIRSGENDGPLSRVRDGATAVFRPVQDGLATLVRPIGGFFSSIGELARTRTANEELRARVEELEARHRALADLQRENDELRALLGMRDRLDLDTVEARVVALTPSSFEWTITIDAGSADGVERNMPVINGSGLVGRVIQVTPRASRVLLAIDPNFSAAARSARTGEVGIIDGRAGQPMRFRPLDPQGDLRVGDEVVTSPYQGGVFPGGIPIGTIADAGDVGARLTRDVEVRPFVDFTRLHHVLVVRTEPVEQVPPLEGTQGLDGASTPGTGTTPDDGDDADGDDAGGDNGDGEDEGGEVVP